MREFSCAYHERYDIVLFHNEISEIFGQEKELAEQYALIHTWGQQSAATSNKDLSLSTSDLRLERDISKSFIWLWLLSSSIRMA